MSLPTIVLIGRTNVGKSTLFNRLLEKPKALVSTLSGTTRDRNEGECLWRGRVIRVVDTGGLDVKPSDEIEKNVLKQTDLALKKADLILFVLDVKTGPMPQEREIAAKLMREKTPVIVVANKTEKHAERLSLQNRQWRLKGLPTPLPISSVTGVGVGDLLDEIYRVLEEKGLSPALKEEIHAVKVAVIGKPNVGKSTLLNAMIGEERFIVSPIAHTTREPNDILMKKGDRNYLLVDTAGMRKSAKVKKAGGLEEAAVERNRRVIERADVVLLVVDASEPLGVQERVLAGLLKTTGTGVIIVANKWDLVKDKDTQTMNRYREYFASSFPFLSWAPVLFVSALTKHRVKNLFTMIEEVKRHRESALSEKDLREFLRGLTRGHTPLKSKTIGAPKILALDQIKTAPPRLRLTVKTKRLDVIPQSYIRYLENRLRERFDLSGTPIFLTVNRRL